MNRCIGCGIKLQNKYVDQLGYTKDLANKYCERCFRTIHYNEERKVNNIDNYAVIDKINKLSYYTLFITDLLSINESIIDIYRRINNLKVLIINKCDIIPNTLKLDHLKDNIKKVYNISEDVYFISAKKKYNLSNIIESITANKKVILCGETSSGKSTLINNLISTNLTTSKYSNTTLDFIKLEYEGYSIYDSPGINMNEKNIYDKIKINTKQVNDKYILSINDIKIRCNGNLTFIVANNCSISSKKDSVNLGKKMNIPANSDILLDGYGFIYVKEEIIIECNKELKIRKSIIGK